MSNIIKNIKQKIYGREKQVTCLYWIAFKDTLISPSLSPTAIWQAIKVLTFATMQSGILCKDLKTSK